MSDRLADMYNGPEAGGTVTLVSEEEAGTVGLRESPRDRARDVKKYQPHWTVEYFLIPGVED